MLARAEQVREEIVVNETTFKAMAPASMYDIALFGLDANRLQSPQYKKSTRSQPFIARKSSSLKRLKPSLTGAITVFYRSLAF